MVISNDIIPLVTITRNYATITMINSHSSPMVAMAHESPFGYIWMTIMMHLLELRDGAVFHFHLAQNPGWCEAGTAIRAWAVGVVSA